MDLLKPSGPKRNHKKGIASRIKDAKRAEAIVRQAEYDSLTVEQKISRLDRGGYRALKQRAKLSLAVIARGL
jgi:hypothetical protein